MRNRDVFLSFVLIIALILWRQPRQTQPLSYSGPLPPRPPPAPQVPKALESPRELPPSQRSIPQHSLTNRPPLPSQSRSQRPPERLDIVLIVADDLRADACCGGHLGIPTPRLSTIAESGLLMSKTYVQGSTEPAVYVCTHPSIHLVTPTQPCTPLLAMIPYTHTYYIVMTSPI